MRCLVAATTAAAVLAIGPGTAAADTPCPGSAKTPTGFQMKCSVELKTLDPYNPALTVWSGASTPLTSLTVTSPPGVTCHKQVVQGTVYFTCGPDFPANTDIHATVTASGAAQPCSIGIYAEISYRELGEPAHPAIGGFGPCKAQPPPTNKTGVVCTPHVAVGQAASCFATIVPPGGGHRTGTVTWTKGSDPGKFPNGVTCALKAAGPGKSQCAVAYVPTAAGDGTHAITAHLAGHVLGTGTVTVDKRATTTEVKCDPSFPSVGETTSCTAVVTDPKSSRPRPSGSVTFTTDDHAGKFPNGASCELAPYIFNGSSSCSVDLVPGTSADQNVEGAYGGDALHKASSNSYYLSIF